MVRTRHEAASLPRSSGRNPDFRTGLVMTPDEKLILDVRDFWRVHDGLEAYLNLDAKGTMDRLRAHKEDALCDVTDYSGSSKLMCTREGYDAIIELAERHRESLPVPDDYSVKELVEGLRQYIV